VNLLVDTSVWSLALRRDSPADCPEVFRLKTALQEGKNVFTTDLILQELLQGFSGPKARKKIIETFASLLLIIPERRDHIDAADLRVKLRQKGGQVSTIEVLFAQLCLRHGLFLLSADKDFTHIAKFAPLKMVSV
jgi:predicted nucleic acid-binding protein